MPILNMSIIVLRLIVGDSVTDRVISPFFLYNTHSKIQQLFWYVRAVCVTPMMSKWSSNKIVPLKIIPMLLGTSLDCEEWSPRSLYLMPMGVNFSTL